MRTVKSKARRAGFLAALAASAIVLYATAASAAAAPAWRIASVSNPTAAPGSQVQYHVQVNNVGETPIPATIGGNAGNCVPGAPAPADPSKCYQIIATFPAGIVPIGAEPAEGGLACTVAASTITCPSPGNTVAARVDARNAGRSLRTVIFTAEVEAGASGTLTSSFAVSGPEAGAATTVDATAISPTPPQFGFGEFDGQVSADPANTPYTQAAGNPYAASTSFEFNSVVNPGLAGSLAPVEAAKDIFAELPPGLLGSPASLARCTATELANGQSITAEPLCPPASQVGTFFFRVDNGSLFTVGPEPLFNMVPPPGVAARFGVNVLGVSVVLDAEVRSGGDYGVSVVSRNISQGLNVQGTTVTLWGVPAAPAHDFDRACPGKRAPWRTGITCPGASTESAFLRNPTACTPAGVGLQTTIRADSWQHPGVFKSAAFVSHLPPGYPAAPQDWGAPIGPTDCDKVPFDPSLAIVPSTHAADSPTGLSVDLDLPQTDDPGSVGTSDLRKAMVELPRGMTVNPSSAAGLGACSSSQVGLTTPIGQTPIHFTLDPADCPDNSKIGEVEIETPLLDHTVSGSVYLAKQGDNPFGALLAMYITAHDPESGVVLKLPGRIAAGEDGRLLTTFDEQPQLPFENLHLDLFGGPRAPLRTPAACGTYTTNATLSPWSGNAPVDLNSSFQIASGPGGGPCPSDGFDPKLSAGTQNPLAGSFSPFILRLSREDGTRELTGLTATLPEGLLGKLAGIPPCPESALSAISGELGTGSAQFANPACPTASQVGTVTAGAGAGSNPFYVETGRAYLAGPYKGAPLSLAIVTPALAGPFDLGNVVVRTALHVDPVTAQIRALSDPLPTILHGIPLDLRDVRVLLGRPDFTLNPTSCDPMSIDATISGEGGASADRSDRFQVGGCRGLGFKPKLSLKLKGGTKRTDHPALIATLTARPGDANIARVQTTLPHAAFLDQGNIRTICTRAQFAADACTRGSIYGRASATTPLFDRPLSGPVYLRSSDNLLPDLVIALRGPDDQPVEVDPAGRTDSVKGALRNTFDLVPDAPITKFRLELFGGKRGLVVLSRNLCTKRYRATVKMDAHNGKVFDTRPALRLGCPKKGKQMSHHDHLR
jgi:hypothetical protein